MFLFFFFDVPLLPFSWQCCLLLLLFFFLVDKKQELQISFGVLLCRRSFLITYRFDYGGAVLRQSFETRLLVPPLVFCRMQLNQYVCLMTKNPQLYECIYALDGDLSLIQKHIQLILHYPTSFQYQAIVFPRELERKTELNRN